MNDDYKELSRRNFIRLGTAGIALSGLGSLIGKASAQEPKPGKIPRRRYGRTGLEISSLVGAADWNSAIIPLAVASGVNYWHKAHRWTAATMPEAIKAQPRESYYLEVVVDRVGGDHMKGHIDEEQHYQFVKECVQRSGAGYYDIFKFHFGYHSVEEAKTELGMVKAFERLKKEGLVKHLTLSQHPYNSIGGDLPHQVINHLIENSSPYEAAQFFYTYGDRQETEDLIKLAKEKDFGTIAMKSMGGIGRAAQDPKFQKLLAEPRFQGCTPGGAMVKWLLSNPNLTAAVIAMKNFQDWEENSSAAMQSGLTQADHGTLGLLAAYNQGLTCHLCSKCVANCPESIAIADILRYERYARDYDDLGRARTEYAKLTKNGASCVACGDCLPVCPRGIDIVAKLGEVHNLLG